MLLGQIAPLFSSEAEIFILNFSQSPLRALFSDSLLVPPGADAHTAVIPAKEVVAKGPEKKGTTKGTKSTKKSFSFVPLWFKAFMPFATPSFVGMTVVVCGVGVGFNASVH